MGADPIRPRAARHAVMAAYYQIADAAERRVSQLSFIVPGSTWPPLAGFFIRSSLISLINSAVRFIRAGRPAWLEAPYYVFPVCIRAQEFRCIRQLDDACSRSI